MRVYVGIYVWDISKLVLEDTTRINYYGVMDRNEKAERSRSSRAPSGGCSSPD
jgi:hypothetical protein